MLPTSAKRGVLNLGYPCMVRRLKNGKVTSKITQKTLLGLKGMTAYQKLVELTNQNLDGLDVTLDYNFVHNVRFYRCYSDLFPHISNRKLDGVLGAELTKKFRNLDAFDQKLKKIGKKLFFYGIRLTFHPNEYACLGSPNQDVIDYSIIDLDWHGRMVLKCVEGAKEFVDQCKENEKSTNLKQSKKTDAKNKVVVESSKKKEGSANKSIKETKDNETENSDSKYNPPNFSVDDQTKWPELSHEAVDSHFNNTVFVLHGGGVYGDKQEALKRWGKTYESLPKHIKDYLVIENDEKNYSPQDLLPLSIKHDMPIVLDFFHQECFELTHEDAPHCDFSEIIPKVRAVWKKRNKRIKFHISGQQSERRLGTHSHFCNTIPQEIKDLQDSGIDVDIMLECKAKEFALYDCLDHNSDRITMKNPLRSAYSTFLSSLDQSKIGDIDLDKNKDLLLITDEEKAVIMKIMNDGKVLSLEEIDHEKALDGVVGNNIRVSASQRIEEIRDSSIKFSKKSIVSKSTQLPDKPKGGRRVKQNPKLKKNLKGHSNHEDDDDERKPCCCSEEEISLKSDVSENESFNSDLLYDSEEESKKNKNKARIQLSNSGKKSKINSSIKKKLDSRMQLEKNKDRSDDSSDESFEFDVAKRIAKGKAQIAKAQQKFKVMDKVLGQKNTVLAGVSKGKGRNLKKIKND